MTSQLAHVEPLASFRDLVALSVVPYARSLDIVHGNGRRISYSDSFWPYPWMLDKNSKYLVAETPAIKSFHAVESFHGQSSPELPVLRLTDVDEPLFEALLLRWKRHYLGKRPRWEDRVLFRSLNMAAQAAQLPAGIDTTLYDVGRMVALWVSAFEILAHPRIAKSDYKSVYALLENVSYLGRNVGRRRYAAFMGNMKKPWPRRSLACWLYGKLYLARNAFLHGSPVRTELLAPNALKVDLFWLAPSLYRLALTGFLGVSSAPAARFLVDPQRVIERALLRGRK